MKLCTVYIIHYLPNDADERLRRRAAHWDQLHYWTEMGLKCVVVASNLGPEDEYRHLLVEYIKTPRVGIANSRNMLLRRFYSSIEDFGIFADDDIILNDTVGSDRILEELMTMNVDRLAGIDLFSPIHPEWHGIDAALKANNGHSLWTFKKNPRQAGHAMFLRNMVKFYNREYYFKNEWAPQPWAQRCGEDVVFALDLHLDGFGVYDCYNMLKVVSNDDTSTWLTDGSDRTQMVDEFEARLVEEYDLPIKAGCVIDWDAVAELDPLSRTR